MATPSASKQHECLSPCAIALAPREQDIPVTALKSLHLAEKLAAFRGRLFVSRAELALTYRVPKGSARLVFYYFVRMVDLLRRFTASAWALKVSDPELAAAAERHARLAR